MKTSSFTIMNTKNHRSSILLLLSRPKQIDDAPLLPSSLEEPCNGESVKFFSSPEIDNYVKLGVKYIFLVR
jgi:hypothetical protein